MVHIIASLFLPYTIDFGPQTQSSPRGSSTPPKDVENGSAAPHNRQQSLFTGPAAPHTVGDVATPFGSHVPSTSPALHFSRPNDPRALARADAQVPEWGRGRIFNQPRSRAEGVPPSTIFEYFKLPENHTTKDLQRLQSRPPRGSYREQGTFTPARTSSHAVSFEQGDWRVAPAIQGNGALTNALQAATNYRMYDEGLFHIGTLGFPTDELSKAMHEEIADYLDGSYDSHAVFVKDSDFDGHYSHYCKTILWPVLNYQIPDHPKSKAYADHSWQYYVKVNEAFADAIVRSYKHGDWIWVHDYHLMLVPALVRKQLPEARIAFFMHNAFPSSEIFRCLAMRRELLEGVLGSNAIMFQAEEYSYHFKQTCGRLLVVEATDAGVQFNGHLVNVSAIPIGIVRDELYRARSDPEVYEWTATLQGRYKDQKILASRDKLDNIRGVKQKLLAYELFLEQNPDWRDHVVLLQVITSTTGNDKDLAAAVSDIVTRINAKYSTLAHSPIVFLKQDIAFAQYLALLTVADVWMVTPLRDGMNLTCHDYIECQDGRNSCSKSHGCLILSEFTGSSELFKGQELAVNPWDFLQMSRSIKHALEMQTDEKERRYLALSDVVKRYDGIRWLAELKEQLGTAHEAHQLRDNHAVPRLPVNVLASRYQSSSRRLFLFDFEGTLDDWRFSHTSDSSTSTRMVDTLSCLIAASPNNTIYVASDRTMQDMENVFECIPDIGLIAENGCFVRPFANDDWQSLAGELSTQAAVWKQGITKQLEYYRERIVGSVIEERDCSIIFRYGQVESGEKVAAARQAGDLADHINEGCHIQRIKAVPLENAISIQPRDVDKVTACQFILDDFQSSKGNRKRSRTVASSTTEDYFTGSPPQEHAGGDHGLPSPISQSSELSESVIREGDVETPRALALSPAMEPSQQQQPIAEDSTSARALPDFLMVAGDDREDEPVYTWANQLRAQKDSADRQSAVDNVFTVCVGTRNTEASHTLTQGVTGLLAALRRLANS